MEPERANAFKAVKIPELTVTDSPEETLALGRLLGKALAPGDAVLLDGDLGAGKTHFTKGLAEALGISETVTSPTFTVVGEYAVPGRGFKLIHMDIYRLETMDDLYDVGFGEYYDGRNILVIEWAEKVEELRALPGRVFRVVLRRADEISPFRREIRIEVSEAGQ